MYKDAYAGLSTRHKKSNDFLRNLVSLLESEINCLHDVQVKRIDGLSSVIDIFGKVVAGSYNNNVYEKNRNTVNQNSSKPNVNILSDLLEKA